MYVHVSKISPGNKCCCLLYPTYVHRCKGKNAIGDEREQPYVILDYAICLLPSFGLSIKLSTAMIAR